MSKILNKISVLFKRHYYGFLSPYVSINKQEEVILFDLIDHPNQEYVYKFEEKVGHFLGCGKVVSFAAGRMAFYALLKSLGVTSGDEVILTGFTCSVMANAVLRTGASIVYADIDANTLGTDPYDCERKITNKTRVIVAQHSFGIPCEIDYIAAIAKNNGIFLIEDCALTLGSSYKGIVCGNWGDAAIFSTDHTKPLNSLIGGFLYTNNEMVYSTTIGIRNSIPSLGKKHQRRIIKQYINESTQESISHKLFFYSQLFDVVKHRLFKMKIKSPYLNADSTDPAMCNSSTYSYPASFPPSLAKIALQSLAEYIASIPLRKKELQSVINILKKKEVIPSAFFDPEREIVPLRVPFLLRNRRRSDFRFVDDWVWFKKPIVATNEPLETFMYKYDCETSESVVTSIMNIPIVLNQKKHMNIIKLLNRLYND